MTERAYVRAAALMNFGEVCRQFGLDPLRLVRQAGLDAGVLSDPDLRIPASRVAAALEGAAAGSGCLTIGLRMAESRRLSDFGAVSLLMRHQPTLRALLETTVQYRRLLNEALVLHIEDDDQLVILREELAIDGGGLLRQAHELAIGTLFRMFRMILGGAWSPIGVHFTHAAPPDLTVHRRLFGREVIFAGDFNGIVSAAADMDRPNPAADPELARYARQFVEILPKAAHRSTAQDVRSALYLLLPNGKASIVEVAAVLGLGPRKLQRRLDAEGIVYSILLAEVRRELAERYLGNTGYSLARIGEMLGYGQPSSFTRWFAGEFGMTPSRRRAQIEALTKLTR
ncbi:MAG: AraC family transcriptional regulator [Actinobacteria bacterium]|nr:AraC family transcriptional regulator [Actinomycetota bacterium]